MDGLTALERELLKFVERLTAASETSAKGLENLERQWVQGMNLRVTGVEECVSELLLSHGRLVDALQCWMKDEQSWELVNDRLNESIRLTKLAESRLKNASPR